MEVDGVVVSVIHGSQTGTVALQLEDGQIKKLLWGEPPSLLLSDEKQQRHNLHSIGPLR